MGSHNIKLYSKIVCLNTKEVFDTVEDASRFSKAHLLDIVLCCKDIYPYAGRLDNKNLVWRYEVDYKKLTDEDISNIIEENQKKVITRQLEEEIKTKVICINTEQVFNDIYEIPSHIDIRPESVRRCCNKKTFYCRDRNERRYIFMYYEEYLKTSPREIINLLENFNGIKVKKVINTRTKEVYESVEQASAKTFISSFTIRKQCNKKEQYSKHTLLNGPDWLYYEDYLKLIRK